MALSVAAATLTDVSNVQPIIITEASDLQDGAVYDLSLSYQDAAGNAAATTQVNGVNFVGAATMAALINSPSTFRFHSHGQLIWFAGSS